MAFNVAIFIPVGIIAALLIPRRRWPLAFVAGFAFTLLIELVQVPEPDRISDPRDLVMNTAGAVFGVLVVLAARLVRRAGQVVHVPVSMAVIPGSIEADREPVLAASVDRAA
jgi:glycopeptide antibiotics resistance protein